MKSVPTLISKSIALGKVTYSIHIQLSLYLIEKLQDNNIVLKTKANDEKNTKNLFSE